MVRFCYWCVNESGEKFNFMSLALLDIGMVVQDDRGLDTVIIDMAIEPDISAMEIYAAREDLMYA